MPPHEKKLGPWLKANENGNLREEYDLNESSLVIDVGGYEGQWASDIFSRYGCTIYIFEPVHEFCEKIQKRFKMNKKIIVEELALSNHSGISEIGLDGMSSSLEIEKEKKERVVVKRALDFFREKHIDHIDLMKINIEGGEYDLLDDLIENDCIKNIDNIQVQFHELFPDAKNRMKSIQDGLKKTHHTTYSFPFVWENWKKTVGIK
ncbi:MAG: FkbM family methyltransferase [Candidatus Pacebacteria bacterium]|nr:FkbM family methyltransferase [Candidatus Paceibacterota bacterium]